MAITLCNTRNATLWEEEGNGKEGEGGETKTENEKFGLVSLGRENEILSLRLLMWRRERCGNGVQPHALSRTTPSLPHFYLNRY